MIINYTGGGGDPKLQSKAVTPGLSSQTVTPDGRYDALSSVTVYGDPDLKSSNIRSGKTIFGVDGSLLYRYQAKSTSGSVADRTIYPDSGFAGLSKVDVAGDSNLVASNIKYGKSIFGVTGTYEHTTTKTYKGPTILSGSASATTKCNAPTATGKAYLYNCGSASGTATTVTAVIGDISGNTTYSYSGGSGTSGSTKEYTVTDYRFYVIPGGTSTSVQLTGSCTLPDGRYKGSVVAAGCTSSGLAGCTGNGGLVCSYIDVSGGTATATVNISHSIGGVTGGSGWKSSVSGTMTFSIAFKVTEKVR